MKIWMKKINRIILLLLCIGIGALCASGKKVQASQGESAAVRHFLHKNVAAEPGTGEEKPSCKKQMTKNEERFFEEAESQGVEKKQAGELFERLLDDDIFQDGVMELTGLRVDDIDENGQTDMLVMVQDAGQASFYGGGGLWFYMNEDTPYCFEEEDCSFNGGFDIFWADIDNDENVEIVFSAMGSGCGAAGDSYKAIFKYKNHMMERMALPSDFKDDNDCGLIVDVIQEPAVNSYRAYCSYLEDSISFYRENVWAPLETPQVRGGNARGYYNLSVVKYEGKNVLQASEYLYGEGGVSDCAATAQFLITWEEDGTPKVIRWWIEEEQNCWAGIHESQICYKDGSYYYASHADHNYLYRASGDGSNSQCLAKVPAGGICIWGDEIYFEDLSEGSGAICRINTDGSGLKKLCERGEGVQAGAEYIYFLSIYEKKYDKTGMVTDEPSELDESFLYRMKKDGSERELLARDVRQFALGDVVPLQEIWYRGFLYISRQIKDKTVVSRMELDGQNEEEYLRFDIKGKIMPCGNSMYYAGDLYGKQGQAVRYYWNYGGMFEIALPEYTDCCMYDWNFYCLNEERKGNGSKITIYQLDYFEKECEIIYEESFSTGDSDGEYQAELYASGGDLFFSRFDSGREGCCWFRLIEDEGAGTWRAEEWEPGT